MRKIVSLASALLLCAALLGACGGDPGSGQSSGSSGPQSSAPQPSSASQQSSSLPDSSSAPNASALPDSDAAAYIALARQALDYMNDGDFAAWRLMVAKGYQDVVSEADWTAVRDAIGEQAGAFKSYGEAEAIAATDPNLGGIMAVYLLAQYENTTYTWEVVFDTEQSLLNMQVVNAQ